MALASLARAEELSVAGVTLPLPSFFPSISTVKARMRPLAYLRVLEGLECPDSEWCRHIDHPRVRHDVMLERRPRRARLGCGPGGDSPGEAARDCRTA